MGPTRAVIYLPPGVDRAVWLPRCLAHCEERRYAVVAVIEDPVGGWQAVWSMLATREADVVVVSRWDHMDPRRAPRIEQADGGDGGEARRPRRA